MQYKRTEPCTTCPYRKDVKIRTWAEDEFKKLLEKDATELGTVYQCHKKDGHVCVGWLIDQDNRDLPSLVLRMSLSKHDVTRHYLDGLKCPVPMYKSIAEMIKSNYPHLLNESYARDTTK